MKNSEVEPRPADAMYGPDRGSDYPYGLRLSLNDDVLDKLGIEKLPELGSEIMLTAKVKVVSREERADQSDETGKYQCMDLQITDMALGEG